MTAKRHTSSKSKGRSAGPLTRYLLKGRSIMLFGAIEPRLTREIITQLLVLDQINGEKPIRIYINSPGGVADDGFAIYDVMRFLKSPVYTIVTGLAASAATIVMVGAPKGNRLILPHSRVMLHQPMGGVGGQVSDIEIQAAEMFRYRDVLNEIISRHSGQTVDKIATDTDRDFFLSAEEAKDYGLVDDLLTRPLADEEDEDA